MEQEKKFADGFSFKRNESAPDFVVGRLSMKVEEAIAFMKENQKNGWINLDVKKARTGNFYLELDTYVPKDKESFSESKSTINKSKSSLTMTDESDDDGLPF